MTLTNRYKSLLSVILVLLLLVQVNALPIHEYNLRQQGYTLVHVPLSEWSGTSAYLNVNGEDLYNIALCDTHFRIQSIAEYEQLFFLLALLLLLGVGGSTVIRFRSSRASRPLYLSCIFLRAPPGRTVPG